MCVCNLEREVSLTIFMPCISFPFFPPSFELVAVTRPHSTVLNSSAERERPCLFSNLRGKASSLAPFCVMLTLDSVYVTYYITKDGNFPVFLVC